MPCFRRLGCASVDSSAAAARRPTPATTRAAAVLAAALAVLAPSTAGAQLVERVVDGDTIIVRGVGRVRLIGVDTPETVDPRRPVEFFGREASAFTKRLLEGKRVRLEYDWERTDRYGRTLAYVYLPDGTFVNAEIIGQGYGHAYTRFPFKHLDRFRQLEREARRSGRGLWGAGASEQAASSELPAEVARWDDNANGRISCAEARAHGLAPVRRGHAAYAFMTDGDGDGVVCESGGGRSRSAQREASQEPAGALRWDDNGNGRISCAEARRHGIAPVRRGHPAYRYMNDPNGDGVVCE